MSALHHSWCPSLKYPQLVGMLIAMWRKALLWRSVRCPMPNACSSPGPLSCVTTPMEACAGAARHRVASMAVAPTHIRGKMYMPSCRPKRSFTAQARNVSALLENVCMRASGVMCLQDVDAARLARLYPAHARPPGREAERVLRKTVYCVPTAAKAHPSHGTETVQEVKQDTKSTLCS